MFEKLCEAAGTDVLFCIIMEGVVDEKIVEVQGTEVLLFMLLLAQKLEYIHYQLHNLTF